MSEITYEDDLTLDPPGSIAIIGAGPLGIEAALYGRFLGYDITLFEANEIANSLQARRDEPLPMLPDRVLSPLALSALAAQIESDQLTLPTTCGEWIDKALVPLTETDLLAGRVRVPDEVTSITTVPIELEEGDEEEDVADIPADFQLSSTQGEASTFEAVIVATGTADVDLDFSLPTPYFFRIGSTELESEEETLDAGRKAIVTLFATLAGRKDLDLYRPRRG